MFANRSGFACRWSMCEESHNECVLVSEKIIMWGSEGIWMGTQGKREG